MNDTITFLANYDVCSYYAKIIARITYNQNEVKITIDWLKRVGTKIGVSRVNRISQDILNILEKEIRICDRKGFTFDSMRVDRDLGRYGISLPLIKSTESMLNVVKIATELLWHERWPIIVKSDFQTKSQKGDLWREA